MNFSMLCLLALIPLISSLPIQPTATDPAITIKLTTDGLKKALKYAEPIMNEVLLGKDFDLKFSMAGKDLEGTFKTTNLPDIEIMPVANDRAADDETGFDSASMDDDDSDSHEHRFKREVIPVPEDHDDSSDSHDDSHDDDRYKRSIETAHAKVMWEDDDFMSGKVLGGVMTNLKGFGITMEMKAETHTYVIEASDVTLKVTTILGSDDGQLRQGKIMAELSGGLHITKDGEDVPMTPETVQEYYKEILTKIVMRYHKEFKAHVTDFTQVFGSSSLPKMLFDFRLTEHPMFTTTSMEMSVVGKFIYDKDSTYKFSTCEIMDSYLGYAQFLSMFKAAAAVTSTGEKTTQVFTIVEGEVHPKYDALKAKTTDEAARVAKGTIILTVSQDFFNSFFQMLVESKTLDLTFTDEQLKGIMSLSEGMTGEYPFPTELTEGGKSLHVKINPVEKSEYVVFSEDQMTEAFSIQIGLGDKFADYSVKASTKFLFKGGEYSRELYQLTVTKSADPGYPDLLKKEMIEAIFMEYTTQVEGLTMTPHYMDIFSQIQFTDKHFTVGIDTSALETMVQEMKEIEA